MPDGKTSLVRNGRSGRSEQRSELSIHGWFWMSPIADEPGVGRRWETSSVRTYAPGVEWGDRLSESHRWSAAWRAAEKSTSDEDDVRSGDEYRNLTDARWGGTRATHKVGAGQSGWGDQIALSDPTGSSSSACPPFHTPPTSHVTRERWTDLPSTTHTDDGEAGVAELPPLPVGHPLPLSTRTGSIVQHISPHLRRERVAHLSQAGGSADAQRR